MAIDRGAAFGALFIGNQRSFGQFDPSNSSMWAEKEKPYTPANIEAHLAGKTGLGMVPILDDHHVRFAAIDIDCHQGKPEIDLVALEQKVRDFDLPLVVCRSKSGGAHLYLFTSAPVEAKLVRAVMSSFASRLGWPGVEVFPKQSDLTPDEKGVRSYGNWINLPYFKSDDTARYCVDGGKRVDFEYFIELANAKRVTKDKLVRASVAEHAEAPPCFQEMLLHGVPVGEGVRNKAVYHAGVYLKRAFPEDWKDRAFDFNNSVLDEPLPQAEARKTINSAGRREYRYRCNDSPCKELCNRQLCLTRKFGIKDEPADADEGGDSFTPLPPIGSLIKFNSEPVKWSLAVDGKPIILTTEQLMDYRRLRMAVAEELMVLMPKRKNDTWHKQLMILMESAVVKEVPDEASTPGLIRAQLEEYIKKANLTESGEDLTKRELLLRGVPVVQLIGGASATEKLRCVVFRGPDFVAFLRKNRSEELRGINMWLALQKMHVGHERLRCGETVINVWMVPIGDQGELKLKPQVFRSDI